MSQGAPGPRHTPWNPLALALAAMPVLQVVGIVSGAGEDSLSNDYLGWVGLVDRVLSGRYDWTRYLRDAVVPGSHGMAFPVAVHLLAARWAHWSHHLELAVGLSLFALKLALLLAAARRAGLRSPWLLPVLSLTVFCTGQTSTYTFGESALQMGFSQAGLALAVWALVRFPTVPLGLILSGLGALVASWSWGGGLLVWGVVLAGALHLRLRRAAPYLALAALLALSLLPYVLSAPGAGGEKHVPSPLFVAGLLGRAFCHGSALNDGRILQGEVMGAAGVLAAVVALALAFTARLRGAIPGALLLGWGFLVALQIGSARTQIAPWYASPASVFWSGLALVAAALWESGSRPRRAAGALALAAVAALAVNADRSWKDKSFYLRSQGPASAECLRHDTSAPTLCEAKLFEWELGRPELLAVLGEPLRRHRLSVFAPRQERTMQGAVILGEVAFQDRSPGEEDVRWAAAREPKRLPWSEPERLNLFLRGPVRATWRFRVPPARRATFVTAVARGRRSAADHARLTVLDGSGGAPRAYQLTPGSLWTKVVLDLTATAGRDVTVVFEGVLPREDGWVVFRAPLLALDGVAPEPPAPLAPRNASIDLAGPPATCDGAPVVRDLLDSAPLADGTTGYRLGARPRLECWSFAPRLLAPLRRLSVVAGLREASPRLLRVLLFIDGSRDPGHARLLEIPLLGDGVTRRYSYDLQLLEAWKETKVTGWTLEPVFPGGSPEGHRMTLGPVVLE